MEVQEETTNVMQMKTSRFLGNCHVLKRQIYSFTLEATLSTWHSMAALQCAPLSILKEKEVATLLLFCVLHRVQLVYSWPVVVGVSPERDV